MSCYLKHMQPGLADDLRTCYWDGCAQAAIVLFAGRPLCGEHYEGAVAELNALGVPSRGLTEAIDKTDSSDAELGHEYVIEPVSDPSPNATQPEGGFTSG